MTSSRQTDRPSVLFVCVHNAGRSQMAAAWLTHLTGDRVEVRSAGWAPSGQVNPAVAEAMRPVFPSKRYLDWKLDDPAAQGMAAVRDEIRSLVEGLIAEIAL